MRSLKPPQVLLFGAMLTIALVIALFPYFPRQLGVSEGNIASRDIRSPRDATFESETLTEQAREAIANAVADATGCRLFELPITAERVLTALRSGREN